MPPPNLSIYGYGTCLKYIVEGPKWFSSHVFTLMCCILRFEQLIDDEGVALKSFFVLAPNSCLFLNKFEDLIVSSQMLLILL